MRKFLFVLMLAVSLSLAAIAQQGSAPTDPKAHAQEVINKAQAALWGDGKSKVQSLSITGTDRLNLAGLMGGRAGDAARGGGGGGGRGGDPRGGGGAGRGGGRNTDTLSEITLDILLPDKFLQTSVRSMGPASSTSLFAINGTQIWNDSKQSNPVSMGGGGGDGGFGGGGDGGGGAPPPPPPGGGDTGRGGGQDGTGGPGGNQRMMGMPGQAQAPDFGRLMFALLLTTPATLPLEFTYAGEAKTADGKTADVLDATGPNNFTMRLFFDPPTHQLLMMSYKSRPMGRGPQGPGQGGSQGGGQGGGQGGQGNRPPDGNQGGNQGRGMGNAPETETRWYLTEYRSESGLNLPHRITKSTIGENGPQPFGEVEIKKVKINPSLKPEKFEKKEEKK